MHRHAASTFARFAACAFVVATLSCASDDAAKATPPATAAPGPDACTDQARWTAAGGTYLKRPDGTEIYSVVAGPSDAPAVLFVHGGPGYNAYTFRQAVGAALEKEWRMVYVDQRGMGRSVPLAPGAPTGTAATVDDFEAVRNALGIKQWHLIGHSFGGVLAVQYKSAHPDHVARMALVDTAVDVGAALTHQVQFAAKNAEVQGWDAVRLHDIAESKRAPSAKMSETYGVVGRLPLQKLLHFADENNQARMEAWDAESGLLPCTQSGAVKAYMDAGLLDGPGDNVAVALDGEAMLITGEQSQVIGEAATAHAKQVWNVDVKAVPNAGHFVYLEAPDAFVAAVRETFTRPAPDDPDCIADAFGFSLTVRDATQAEPAVSTREDRHVTARVTFADGLVLEHSIGGCAHVGEQMRFSGASVAAHAQKTGRPLAEAASALMGRVQVLDYENNWSAPSLKQSIDAALAANADFADGAFACGDAHCEVHVEADADHPVAVVVTYSFAM